MSLKYYAKECGTDKYDHGFCDFYEKHFNLIENLKQKKIRLLEIGVFKGKSLEMWQKYFPLAEIHGIDIENAPHPEGTHLHIVDMNDIDAIQNFIKNNGFWDIIIDDGAHTMSTQQNSLIYFWDYLLPGGLFIMEDLHSSFLPDWKPDIFNKSTYYLIECLKNNQCFEYMCTENYVRLLYLTEYVDIYKKDPNVEITSITSVIKKKEFSNIKNIKNISIVTSVLDCPSNISVYNRVERFEQTKITIQTLREKIPNNFIVLIDISDLTIEEKNYFNKSVDLLLDCSKFINFRNNVYVNKNYGETNLILHSLLVLNNLKLSETPWEYKFESFPNLKNIFKISGRYFLNDNFAYDEYDNDYNVVQIINPDLWFNKCHTCFYKISMKYIKNFITFFKDNKENIFHNNDLPLEHYMFIYLTRYSSIIKNIETLGLSGNLAAIGKLGHY